MKLFESMNPMELEPAVMAAAAGGAEVPTNAKPVDIPKHLIMPTIPIPAFPADLELKFDKETGEGATPEKVEELRRILEGLPPLYIQPIPKFPVRPKQ